MVKNAHILRKFEREYAGKEKLSFHHALKIFEAMWMEALRLGSIKKAGRMEGIEAKIRMAKIVNGL